MKFKKDNELLIVYLYNVELNLKNQDSLTKDIKNLLVKIIRNYHISFSGIYQVIIYENKYYGCILEILQIKEFEYGDFIDLKIDIRHNQDFYFVTDNYTFIENLNHIYYKNNLYFVKLDSFTNINLLIEYGDIFYKDIPSFVSNSVMIK